MTSAEGATGRLNNHSSQRVFRFPIGRILPILPHALSPKPHHHRHPTGNRHHSGTCGICQLQRMLLSTKKTSDYARVALGKKAAFMVVVLRTTILHLRDRTKVVLRRQLFGERAASLLELRRRKGAWDDVYR